MERRGRERRRERGVWERHQSRFFYRAGADADSDFDADADVVADADADAGADVRANADANFDACSFAQSNGKFLQVRL